MNERKKPKTSVVLYHDIRGPMELLTDEQRGRMFLAILNYSEFGEVPEFEDSGMTMAFAFVRNIIDRDAVAWMEKRQERAASGRKGGLKTQEQNRRVKANQAQLESALAVEANQAVPVPAPVLVPAPVPESVIGGAKAPRTRFCPPTFDEVSRYCRERKNQVDPQRFIDYYTANGWKVGRNQMKDWRAALRTWERREDLGAQDKRDISSPARYTYSSEESL